MTTEDHATRMAALAERMAQGVEAGIEAQMRLLLAEMEALLAIMPTAAPQTEAERLATEASVEEGFDNMPV